MKPILLHKLLVLGEIAFILIYQIFMPNNNEGKGNWKLGGSGKEFYAYFSVCGDCSYLITCYILYAGFYLEKKKVTSKHNKKDTFETKRRLVFIWVISKKKTASLLHFKETAP